MATENLDAFNLESIAVGGTIKEDLMDVINDVSPVDRPFCDATGTTDSGAPQKDFVREDLKPATPDNARVDGSDSSSFNDTRTGERISNQHQIMSKKVSVSDRARSSDTVGTSDELLRQLMKRQKELRRDEEAAFVSRNAAVPATDTVAGKLAGVGAWIGTGQSATNTFRGATGADPILSGNPGGYPVTAATDGTPRAGSETLVKDGMKAAYLKGGDPTVAMSTPDVIQGLSDYLFTSSARVATLQSDASQSNRTNNSTGGGKSGGGVVAQGSVNMIVTNFGTLELVPNRFQPETVPGVADLYLLDMTLWDRAYLQGYQTKELARNGLAENREITVDVTLCSYNEEGNAVIADIDGSAWTS